MGGPAGGTDMPAAGGVLMEEARWGNEGEAEGGKGELLVRGETRVEVGGGGWEGSRGGTARGLLKAGGAGPEGRGAGTVDKPMETELLTGPDRPEGAELKSESIHVNVNASSTS